jgi:hypothetical protein
VTDGVGSGINHNIGTAEGTIGSYQALALNNHLFLVASQKGTGFADVGLPSASYEFGVSAVPEPATYGMLLAGMAVFGLAGRRRRKFVGASVLAAASLAGTAQAANYVQVAGQHLTFYYDADYWGIGAASVTGDRLVMAAGPYVDRSATGYSPSEKNVSAYSDASAAAVIAVAHTGYALTGEIGYQAQIDYALAASGSKVDYSSEERVRKGIFSNGGFGSDSYIGDLLSSQSESSTGVGSLGKIKPASQGGLFDAPSRYSDMSSLSFSYDFAVAAVPEPATYGMLLVGLGALALAARRKPGSDSA